MISLGSLSASYLKEIIEFAVPNWLVSVRALFMHKLCYFYTKYADFGQENFRVRRMCRYTTELNEAPILRLPVFVAELIQCSGKTGLFLFRYGQFLDQHFADTEFCGF